MDSRIVPLDELAVVPDHVANARSIYIFRLARGWKHGFDSPSWRNNGSKTARLDNGSIDKARYSKVARVCKMNPSPPYTEKLDDRYRTWSGSDRIINSS